jgi:hypothetical protein
MDAVLQYVDAEMAKLLAADPDLDLARQRAIRRAGRSGSRRPTIRRLAATY